MSEPNVSAFLDLWTEVADSLPRRSRGEVGATAAEALASPLRARLVAALLAIGYPCACASTGALGSTLARLAVRGDGRGRRLARWRARRGHVWYVVGAFVVIFAMVSS